MAATVKPALKPAPKPAAAKAAPAPVAAKPAPKPAPAPAPKPVAAAPNPTAAPKPVAAAPKPAPAPVAAPAPVETAPATEGETTAAPAETEAKKELTPEELEAKKAARKAISGFLSQPHTAFEGHEAEFTVSVLTKDEAGNIVAPAAKRPGKKPYERFMKYVDGALLSEILAQEGGPTRADVVWDEQHGYIQLIAVS